MSQFGCCLTYYALDLYSTIQHHIAESDVIGKTKHSVTDMAVILSQCYFNEGCVSVHMHTNTSV